MLPAAMTRRLPRKLLVGLALPTLAAVLTFAAITAVGMLLDGLGTGERLSFALTALLLAGVLFLLARPRVTADEDLEQLTRYGHSFPSCRR